MNRVLGLKWSLLLALGIVPIACSSSSSNDDDDDSGGTSPQGGSESGLAGQGGKGGSNQAGNGGSIQGGGGGAPQPNPHCTPVSDPKTGFVTCQEGYSHRPQAVACIAAPIPGEGGAGGVGGAVTLPRADGTIGCDVDDDCNSFYLGYCSYDGGGGGSPSACESGCASDTDCGAGRLCVCHADGSPGGICKQTNCTTDADCAGGYLCASFNQGCGPGGFACQTVQDECVSNDDCGGTACGGYVLQPPNADTQDGFRTCDNTVCGRPFLVEEQARVAPVVSSAAWTTAIALSPRVDHLTAVERFALADHWTRMGQMEHASIAAFARFSLQLLSLGAPPELVDACTQALSDETTHTKLCFALASAYAGHAIGPGPLDVARSLEVSSLAEIVDLVIAEGCFGETSAALEALEAAETATDPVIVAAYSQIARDEQRHAELAFRFVRWALERDPLAVTPRVVQALAEQSYPSPAVQDVVEPCLYAVLARRQAA